MWFLSAFAVLLAVCGLWVLEMGVGVAERHGWRYAATELAAAAMLVAWALIIAAFVVSQ